ncbi:biosynthetic-type acetolactate synthase large subunit [Candidatus Walczuchella monophlebidarum]|uniref:Acetolactate synthase n=1 Tax=Candidatus Walczuchella monophlebidarum TaxID=1415657 RepID=A0A068DSQ9_9FLAO|nr:biosynthetic-type acetolactate synthase large subunit [Candidatus Walczuchella monophlebidarum]AID37429.1 acetolactate synthase large subunit [Candidatus Walczuchella monophlebidarum]
MNIKKYKGSEILVKNLLIERVEYLFGYPGGAIMSVSDSLDRHAGHICHILTRHEQGAIHAAQGYARVSGKVGVCISTSGPGATNLITGLADALIDSTPIICITGQVSYNLLGTDAFQETNILDISFPVTKWNVQIPRAQDICQTIRKSFFIARSGRPGPVLIDITKDAQLQEAIFEEILFHKVSYFRSCPKVEVNKIEEAAILINAAKRPLILVGQGVILAEAEEELKALSEKANIPIASTLLGIRDNNHPLFVGMIGMHGHYAPNVLTNQCDILIAIGMRFDDRVTGNINIYAIQAQIIHLEIEACEIGKNIPCDVPVLGDCKKTLPLLTERVQENIRQEWISDFITIQKQEEKIGQKDLYTKKESLTMGEIIQWINQYKNKNAVMVTDVGQHQMIASRYFYFSSSKSQITSGGLGTMGFSLPAAMGAKFGARYRQIICVIGDGGFQMTFQELGILLKNNLPIKIVLLNNGFLGMVRQWQELFFKRRYAFSALLNPDFIRLAQAYNISGKKIEKRKKIPEAVKEMFDCNTAYLLEIIVEREYNVFPMITIGTYGDEIRLY